MGGQESEDHRWMEAHVLKGGDLLVYGRLAEELDELPTAILWKELRAAAEGYLACGSARTRRCHEKVDDLLASLTARDARFGYPPPFCHKGCAACCHEPVYCTVEEAREILDHCRERGIGIDRAKLERQLAHLETDGKLDHTGATTWNDQEEDDQACVFLNPEDRACQVWPVRPFVCRVHLAEGTDRHCRPRNGVEDPEAAGISYLETSYLLTAIFTLHRDSIRKTLGRLLLDLLGGRA